jgi:NAD(P)-dependent dehydrogenase (short-subunit alcohol dehydrogenase family)
VSSYKSNARPTLRPCYIFCRSLGQRLPGQFELQREWLVEGHSDIETGVSRTGPNLARLCGTVFVLGSRLSMRETILASDLCRTAGYGAVALAWRLWCFNAVFASSQVALDALESEASRCCRDDVGPQSTGGVSGLFPCCDRKERCRQPYFWLEKGVPCTAFNTVSTTFQPSDSSASSATRLSAAPPVDFTLPPSHFPTSMVYEEYKGKVVLLTGIGQSHPDGWGNGAAAALLMARQGAHVFGCDLTLEAARYTQKRIQAQFGGEEDNICGDVTVMAADVTSSTSVKALVEACLSKHGRIDILVNNVGRSEPGGPVELSEGVWDEQTDVNLKSVYLTCHHVLPIMEKQGSGVIINVGSIAGMRYVGKPQVAYSATKAAVVQFTKATAVLYAPKGIRLNVVVPGLMDTPLMKRLADKYAGGDLVAFSDKRHKQVPMGRMGDGLDVGNAVLFLASDGARYITGQKLVVDGGITSSTG